MKRIPFKISTLLLFVAAFCIKASAQVNPDGSMSYYEKDFQYGVSLHTRGFAINTKYTIDKKYDIRHQFDIDWVASMKHYREYTYRNTGTRAFVFGKKNEFSILRATYGHKRMISDFENSLSVRVNLHYGIGANLGILKPEYYLESSPDNNQLEEVLFDEQRHFYPNQFYGAAKWTRGLSELKFRPGVTGKIAMSFEWGRQDDQFKSLETGLMVDLYGQRMPIMAFVDNDFIFINLYAALMIGSRW